jgi:cytochrome c oxidase subunit II
MKRALKLAVPAAQLLQTPAWAAVWQDALHPSGVQAGHIHDLWQLMLYVCTAVWGLIVLVLLIALWRAPRAQESSTPLIGPRTGESPIIRTIVAATGVSILALLGLLVASVLTDRALAKLDTMGAVQIQLTGHQWWWEVSYDDARPAKTFATANELHVPVGRPVSVTLQSSDVIHSFWVPNLHGKQDLIPGRVSEIRFRADRAGTYRGQCAEFCGYQHAKMALLVVAEEAQQYERWAESQRASAREPAGQAQRRCQQLFLHSTCAMCHAIQGTPANARAAPDLTHLASRTTLGAGVLPNQPHTLAAWIRDPQSIKPGVNMPAHPFAGEDLSALVAYLGILK